jgi:hypothetical protein
MANWQTISLVHFGMHRFGAQHARSGGCVGIGVHLMVMVMVMMMVRVTE